MACTTNSEEKNEDGLDEVELRKMLATFGSKSHDCEHIFIVSQYQCKGCVDRILPAMITESLQPVLKSSCWFAPYQEPTFLAGYNVSWEEISQVDIEKIIPYAANISYIRLEPSGVSVFQELGVKWVEVQQLEQLFE
jgi:hypothetical protein